MEYNETINLLKTTILNKDEFNVDNIDGPSISMEDLYPALIQCFGIIICGYLAGVLKIITNAETKGLNTFVGTFSLPSLIFLSLVELDWQTVNWKFLLSILISKGIVFFFVVAITMLVSRPLNFGRAGILATFCTQSNDFAIGYPILMALYEKSHPEYASYLYLMAPISLAILNPIGYVLLEISKMNETQSQSSTIVCPELQQNPQTTNRNKRGCILVYKTIRSILFNPIVFMTLLGMTYGILFKNALPTIVSGVLRVFGNSFSATALFLLGLRMLGTGNETQRPGFLTPSVLILVKLLVLPLVNRQTVNVMNAGTNFSDTTDLSTYAFLYGTFPSAPGVFVIATQYQTDVDLIASSMVACTFISGPLMFISAKMISLTNLNPADYLNELDSFAFDISILSIIACCWIIILFGLTNKFNHMPHRITYCLVISQLIGCIGIIMWSTLGNKSDWTMYVQFSLFTIGSYSSRLWTCILAITLLFLQCRSLCFVLKLWPYFVTVAWGIPTILVAALLLIDHNNITPTEKRNPSFQYGNAQAAISVFLLVMCLIVTVGCLVLHQRYKKKFEKYLVLSKEVSSDSGITESTTSLIQSNSSQEILPATDINFSINNRVRHLSKSDDFISNDDSDQMSPECSNAEECCTRKSTATTVVDIEDLVGNKGVGFSAADGEYNQNAGTSGGLCSSTFNCNGSARQTCEHLIREYHRHQAGQGLLEPLELPENVDEHQTMKHIVLLILLLCAMFVGLALSIWTLVMEGMSGIYVELAFLDAFLNFGQSLIVLACFITNTGDLFPPFAKYWRKLWYGANVLNLPDWNNVSSEAKQICEQFKTYHLDACRKTIPKDKRWRIKIYKNVFYGNTFVDWLIEVGLANDRFSAEQYAKHLIDGRVLRHINNVYHFHDKNLLYTFCSCL